MPIQACEIDGSSIVLIGNFNPAIFHPSWFAQHQILSSSEADHAQTQVVSPDVSSFTTDWLTLQATRERFLAATADARRAQPLHDLVVSVFTILEHTPVRQMGINRDQHFPSTRDQMMSLGEKLAPKALWRDVLEEPLMETLVIVSKGTTNQSKALRVTVQPSIKIIPGIYIGTNEHFEIEAEHQQTPRKSLELLDDSWLGAMAHSKKVAEALIASVM